MPRESPPEWSPTPSRTSSPTSSRTGALALLRESAAAALSLVFPTSCAGCDEPDVALCASCRAQLTPAVVLRSLDGLRVCAGVAFDGVPARVLRAAKEDGRGILIRALAPALAAAAAEVLRHGEGSVMVAPIPTSPQSMRRRGFRIVDLLAAHAGLHPRPLLRVQARAGGHALDQRALGRDERLRNTSGRLRAVADLSGRTVLIVDDVVTTGSTLLEAERALTAAGAVVLGAATVASTPLRHMRGLGG